MKRLWSRKNPKMVHIGVDNPKTGGYLTLCGRSMIGSNIQAASVNEIRGDECETCQKSASGKEVSVGGKPIGGGVDWPGAIRNPRGAKERVQILPKKISN